MRKTDGVEPCRPASGPYAGIYGGGPKRRSVSGTDASGNDLADFRRLFSENCFAQGKDDKDETENDNLDPVPHIF